MWSVRNTSSLETSNQAVDVSGNLDIAKELSIYKDSPLVLLGWKKEKIDVCESPKLLVYPSRDQLLICF